MQPAGPSMAEDEPTGSLCKPIWRRGPSNEPLQCMINKNYCNSSHASAVRVLTAKRVAASRPDSGNPNRNCHRRNKQHSSTPDASVASASPSTSTGPRPPSALLPPPHLPLSIMPLRNPLQYFQPFSPLRLIKVGSKNYERQVGAMNANGRLER